MSAPPQASSCIPVALLLLLGRRGFGADEFFEHSASSWNRK